MYFGFGSAVKNRFVDEENRVMGWVIWVFGSRRVAACDATGRPVLILVL